MPDDWDLQVGNDKVYRTFDHRIAAGELAFADMMEQFNNERGVCDYAGKTVVVYEGVDNTGHYGTTFSKAQDQAQLLAPVRYINVEFKNARARIAERKAFPAWSEWKHRRTYKGVVFVPDRNLYREGPRAMTAASEYNLWQGYRFRPRPGACARALSHIRDIWCAANDDAFQFVINHMAAIVQYPERTGLPVIVLQGEQGTGKNILIEEFFLKLFGVHALLLDKPEQLTGD